MCENGVRRPKDYAEAVKWYRLAADQGNLEAQFNLARMYLRGRGVPKDDPEERKWLDLFQATVDDYYPK